MCFGEKCDAWDNRFDGSVEIISIRATFKIYKDVRDAWDCRFEEFVEAINCRETSQISTIPAEELINSFRA